MAFKFQNIWGGAGLQNPWDINGAEAQKVLGNDTSDLYGWFGNFISRTLHVNLQVTTSSSVNGFSTNDSQKIQEFIEYIKPTVERTFSGGTKELNYAMTFNANYVDLSKIVVNKNIFYIEFVDKLSIVAPHHALGYTRELGNVKYNKIEIKTMNADKTTVSLPLIKNTIMHELGHSAGLWHIDVNIEKEGVYQTIIDPALARLINERAGSDNLMLSENAGDTLIDLQILYIAGKLKSQGRLA